MIHPQTRVAEVSAGVGRGVFATAPIPRGTVTWLLDALDGSWPLETVDRWPAVYRDLIFRTCFRFGDRLIQPWDHARQVNHSCTANCGGTEHGFEVALRDIAAGEQLTNDYALFALPAEPPFPCRCGSRECRGDRPFDSDERRVASANSAFAAARAAAQFVPQPLLKIFGMERREVLRRTSTPR